MNPSSGNDIALGPGEALKAIMDGNPLGLVDLGIMLLIATPIARLFVALFSFTRGSEWKMVAVSAAVLGIIGIAILIGAR